MAIVTNIGTLKQELQSYLYDRLDLADKLPNFIDMAQKRIFRVLQSRENEAQFTSPLPGSGYPVPLDYTSLKYLLVNGVPMTSITARNLKSRISNTPAVGMPNSFARINDAFQFHPPADSFYDVELYYYADLSSDVTDDAATNDVLTTYPDLYLWGSLLMAAPFLNEDERLGTWSGLYDDTLRIISEEVFDEEHSGSNLSVSSVY
jgi:hypothetical protein